MKQTIFIIPSYCPGDVLSDFAERSMMKDRNVSLSMMVRRKNMTGSSLKSKTIPLF